MFLAALLAVSTLASCGGDGGAKNDTDPADVTTASGGDGETSSGDSDETTIAPLEKRDLGGRTINAFIRTEWDYEFVIDEESVGDTVSVAGDCRVEREGAVEVFVIVEHLRYTSFLSAEKYPVGDIPVRFLKQREKYA